MKVWLVEYQLKGGSWAPDSGGNPCSKAEAVRRIRLYRDMGDAGQYRPAAYLRVEPAPRKKKVRKK